MPAARPEAVAAAGVPPPAGPADRPHPLATAVQYVRGVGPQLAEVLGKMEIRTVGDVLHHFPARYEDRSHFVPLDFAHAGQTICSSGTLVAVTLERTQRRGMQLVRAEIRDASGSAELVFFNQPWLRDSLGRVQGRRLVVYGPTTVNQQGFLSFTSPEWEVISDEKQSLHANRIVPIHPSTAGITPKQIRTIVANALQRFGDTVVERLPGELRASEGLIDLQTAIRQIHFPDSASDLELARRRLAFEELFVLQLGLALRKRVQEEELPGIAFDANPGLLPELERSLPFTLTAAQVRVIGEILADMGRPKPMNRLLQGDVGSGKTVVAAAAILCAVRSGYQVAMMVPTEILADQHYSVMTRLLKPLGIRLHRLVGSVRARGKRLIKEELAAGDVDMVIGTHALIQATVEFHRLGLAIIDEQHRFGVLQRLDLLDKGSADQVPDVLVMTATPIPRTLALTVYGDLDVSVVDELPPSRRPVKTHWKRKDQRDSVYRGIRTLVEQGRQVYFLCPLVEGSDRLQARAATEMAAHLRDIVFPDLRIGLLHGQLPSHEKDETMEQFREGEIDILVATVVIEVGVDVPNACCMVIEDAERFGLAQLHQLRGRVGRGAEQSYCILLADPRTPEGAGRVEVMVRTTDGFEIAEEDLRLRGPGEFAGTRQSGILKLRIASIIGDHELLERARQAAFSVVSQDPTLAHPDHAALRDLFGEDGGRAFMAAAG